MQVRELVSSFLARSAKWLQIMSQDVYNALVISYSAWPRNLVSEQGRRIVRDVLSGNIDVPSYHSALSIAHAHLHHGRFAQGC